MSDCDSVSSPPLSPVSEELSTDVESDASYRFSFAPASPPRPRHLDDPRQEYSAVSPHSSSADSFESSPSSSAAGLIISSDSAFGRAARFGSSFREPAAESHRRPYLGNFKPLPPTWREANFDWDGGRHSLASSSSLDFQHSRPFGSNGEPCGAEPRHGWRNFALEDAVPTLIPPTPTRVDFTMPPPRPFSTSSSFPVSSKRCEELPPRPATAFASSSYRVRPVGVQPSVRGSNAFEDMASQRRRCCQFCKNNGERESCYRSHPLKDDVTGLVTCPVLRKHVCDICGKTGDEVRGLNPAHDLFVFN